MAMDHTLADGLEWWPSEDIPHTDILYLRVHKDVITKDGFPGPGAFCNQPKSDPSAGMSTNWNKYSSAARTRCEGRKDPSEYAVVELAVDQVREIVGQQIVHTPRNEPPRNRAHTDVFGEKKSSQVRVEYARISRNYAIRLEDSVTEYRSELDSQDLPS